jgi:hypothetical protein
MATNQKITATFSEAVAPASCTTATFTLKQAATPVAGAVSCVGRTATFAPTGNLTASTAYTATVTTGVTDLAGNALAVNHTWTFTTGTTTDVTAPTVISTDPANAATGVPTNRNISATFNKGIDPATITPATFTLTSLGSGPGCTVANPCTATPVDGSVSSIGSVATFVPTITLTSSTTGASAITQTYTATTTIGVKDLAGNAAVSHTWSFATGDKTVSAVGPAPVSLGSAVGFAILTKSGVTDVPASAITGDVGASPISGSAIGVTCAEVTGTIHSVDAAGPLPCRVTDPSFLTTAVSDMEIAYTDAAGRTVPAAVTELGAGDITGLNLAPGLYKWGTGVMINAPGVTLTGSANDVWIFQIGVDLTVGNGAIVTLAGGALARNVFWQVAGKATLGTTANFKGTILSKTLISLNTGAVISGRALAQTAVTLNQSPVTKP